MRASTANRTTRIPPKASQAPWERSTGSLSWGHGRDLQPTKATGNPGRCQETLDTPAAQPEPRSRDITHRQRPVGLDDDRPQTRSDVSAGTRRPEPRSWFTADAFRVERVGQPSEHPAQEKPDGHGNEYSDRQATVKRRKLAYNPSVVGGGFRRLTWRL